MGAGIAQWDSAGRRAGWSRVRIPVRAGNFSLHHRVQTGSGAHPDSYRTCTKGSFPAGKEAEGGVDHSHPSSVEVKNAWNYTSTLPTPLWRGDQLKHRNTFTFTLTYPPYMLRNEDPHYKEAQSTKTHNKITYVSEMCGLRRFQSLSLNRRAVRSRHVTDRSKIIQKCGKAQVFCNDRRRFATFRSNKFFYGKGLLAPRPTHKLEDHPLSLFATAYSIHSQLPSVTGGLPYVVIRDPPNDRSK
jgi:hypothetical protein